MKRILIVDDSLELGRLLQTVFLTFDPNLSIQVVPSAEEALLESSRQPVDLLVSDVRLPGMSGLDLVKKVRLRNPSVRVIILTGLTDPKVMEGAHDLKVNGFFRKPVDMNVFLATARKCLELPAESPLNMARAPVGTTRTGPAVNPAPAGTPIDQNDVMFAPRLGTRLHESVSEMVVGLRQRLGATAVFLLDDRGRIVVQAGDVPALPFEEHWSSAVMAALAAGAKVSRLVGESAPSSVMAFPGKNFQLVLAPTGNYALLMLLKQGSSVLRLALALEEVLESQQRLGESLARLKSKFLSSENPEPLPGEVYPAASPASLPDVQSEPAPQHEPALDEFEALFQKSSEYPMEKDVNAFWDALDSSVGSSAAAGFDGLTYDQARKLGLAPKGK